MRVLHVTELRDLEPHAEPWDRLARTAPGGHPMSSAAWVVPTLAHGNAGADRWHVFLAIDGDRLVGVLPLSEYRVSRVPAFRTARAPVTPHAIATSVLADPGDSRTILTSLLGAARGAMPSALRLELPSCLDGSPVLHDESIPGFRVLRAPGGRGAFVDTARPYARYRATLSRNARNNLNKAANKLRSLRDVRFRRETGADARPEWLETFAAVESSGWKGRAETGMASSPAVMRFYEDLVQRLARRRWLEWHVLEGDGQVLAANLAIRCGPTVYIWKLGYLEAYRRCSPGSLLLRFVLEEACRSDVDRVDLMTDFSWYDRWQMAHYPYRNVTYYPTSLPGRIAHQAVSWRRRLRPPSSDPSPA